jgi:single-strand DNA-binding protein
MASFNRVILVGNLTRDVELRYIPSGTPVADVTVAVNDRRKTSEGEWVDEPTFVDVTLWGRNAEVASEYLGKGAPVLIEGRLKLDRWETEGQKRSKLRVICEKMQMLGSRTGGGGGSSAGAAPGRPAGAVQESYGGGESYDTGSSQYGGGEQSSAGMPEAGPSGSGSYGDSNIPF